MTMIYFYIALFAFSFVMFIRSIVYRRWDDVAVYFILIGFSWIGVCSGTIWSQVDFGIGDGVEWHLIGS